MRIYQAGPLFTAAEIRWHTVRTLSGGTVQFRSASWLSGNIAKAFMEANARSSRDVELTLEDTKHIMEEAAHTLAGQWRWPSACVKGRGHVNCVI